MASLSSPSSGLLGRSATFNPSWSMFSMPRNGPVLQQHHEDAKALRLRAGPAPQPVVSAPGAEPPTSGGSSCSLVHPVAAYHPQHFEVVALSRPSTSVPWGIVVSLVVETGVLLVGSVAHRPQVRLHSSSGLVRGDCVWAVNGWPVPTLGSSLNDVTNYLRQCTVLHLSVWRISAKEGGGCWSPKAAHDAVPSRALSQPLPLPVSQFHVPSPLHHGNVLSSPTPSFTSAVWGRTPVVTPPAVPRKATNPARCVTGPSGATTPSRPPPKREILWSDPYTNQLFRDGAGRPVPYVDSWEPDDVDEGHRCDLFLPPVGPFHDWLSRRKRKWRAAWDVTRPVANLVPDMSDDDDAMDADRDSSERHSSAVAIDFWSQQGYASWEQWLRASKHKWSKRYSWNQRKRQRYEIETQVSVEDDFGAWLQVRKRQWLVSRRKRLRQRQHPKDEAAALSSSPGAPKAVTCDEGGNGEAPAPTHNRDLLLIDELLEEEEQRRKAREDRPPIDLSFLFEDGACPDDTVVHVLGYLEPVEYGKLLCIRRNWRQALIHREGVWRDLCPKRWTLPRRPRKPWHEMFFTNLRREKESSQKRWDDLLSKLSKILEKGDFVQQVEKLVNEAERSFGFHINYSSGVVCERNAILNLAVIQKRHKIVRWLVEAKNADIETFDRGHFTPLLNAAWGGDKYMVRFLLQHGADRSRVGFYHYTKPLASPDFQGRTAADWADAKGFEDVATLIRMGL